MRACADAFRTFANTGSFLRLPITVPFDEHGMVQLGTAPPQPDAPRVPAALEISCREGRYDLALCRTDGRPLLVPGVLDADGVPAAVVRLTFGVTAGGMEVAGTGPDGAPLPLDFDDTTAQALATALLITIGVKLTKAGRARNS